MSEEKQSNGKHDAYEDRNLAVLSWFKMIQEEDLGRVGFYNDDDSSDEWVVLICESQRFGQISYHCPRGFVRECGWINEVSGDIWDGHSRDEKNNRLKGFMWENFTA